jgi:uncharacterized protein (TIGR03118 family)
MRGIRRRAGIHRVAAVLALAAATQLAARPAPAQNHYKETDLVSDILGRAQFLDPMLVNPWGISMSATSPFWVANNGTGTSTLYNTLGVKQGLVVTVPGPGGVQGAPTGTVFNNAGAAFPMTSTQNARFLFATEDGTINGWNPAVAPTTALVIKDLSKDHAIYKGLAIAGSGSAARLYAANFHAGRMDVWDGTFSRVFGGFVDPTLPKGYAPFDVQNVGGQIFVTYAKQDASRTDDVPGPGNGFVDVYSTSGALVRRLVSNGSLNSPWGLALAPTGWGAFGGDLLVGNFGDGAINAYDPLTGSFIGRMNDAFGAPITIPGLWALQFGNGGNGGDPNKLYFTAGLPDDQGNLEAHGLFGSLEPTIAAVPEPGSCVLVVTGLLGLVAVRRRSRTA